MKIPSNPLLTVVQSHPKTQGAKLLDLPGPGSKPRGQLPAAALPVLQQGARPRGPAPERAPELRRPWSQEGLDENLMKNLMKTYEKAMKTDYKPMKHL